MSSVLPAPEKYLNKYETVVILHPDVSEQQQKDFFKKNKKIIQDFKGSVHALETWGKRKLANPIEKVRMGIYFHGFFEAHGEVIAELERTMRINDRVLRFHHLRLDDRATLQKHHEDFHETLKASRERDQEREAKAAAKKSMRERRPLRS